MFHHQSAPTQRRRFLAAGLVSFQLVLGGWAATYPAVASTPPQAAPGKGRIIFNLPSRSVPGSREGGASRGVCNSNSIPLIALLPTTNLGYTTKAHPSLFFYIPTTPAQAGQFILQDDHYQAIYETPVTLPGGNGILQLDTAQLAGMPELKLGQQYHWYFTLVCDPGDPSANVSVDGWIVRTQAPSQLLSASAEARPALYAAAGVWYDSLASLAVLRQTDPQDPTWQHDWQDLLTQVNLGQLSQAPFLSQSQKP